MTAMKNLSCLPLFVILLAFMVCSEDIHGGIKMGVSNNMCDNAKDNLEVDWDNSTNKDFTCLRNENYIPVPTQTSPPKIECIPKDENFPKPLHKCMYDIINYTDQPPRAGPHRPLWPVYGRYLYAPPQRWVHSLEHGAAVFLYHPCSDFAQIEKLIDIAKSCLRRYIITPYKGMPTETPYGVVTYGCRLMMSVVDENAVKDYIQTHALTAPEKVSRDGQYSYGLEEKSQTVEGSDFDDSTLCPKYNPPTQKKITKNFEFDDGLDNLIK